MQQDDTQEDGPSVAELLRAIVDEMLAPYDKQSPRGAFYDTEVRPPFDISKPNQHDTKAEFNRERNAAQKAHEHLQALFDSLFPRAEGGIRAEIRHGLHTRIDAKLRENARRIPATEASALVRKNAADIGGVFALLLLILDYQRAFEDRLRELEEQEERFWNVNHRAPDYYAREIALRLARLYAGETGRFPTLGTSPYNGSPSTDFARALARTFEVLEIRSHHRGPAEWAVGQLTDEDLQPKKNFLLDLPGFGPPPTPRNHLAELDDAIQAKKSPPE